MRTDVLRIAATALGVAGLVLGVAYPADADLAREIALTRALAEEMVTKLRPRQAVAEPSEQRSDHPAVETTRRPSGPHRTASRAALEQLIDEAAVRHGLTPAFVRAVVAAESAYDPRARSPKGAMGLMQLMPATASLLGVHDPWDPAANVDGGVRFLADLLAEFRDAERALIGYNAGPEVVRRGWRIPDETRVYVHSVMTHFRRLRDASVR